MRTDGSDRNERRKDMERSPLQSLKELMNSDYVKKRFMEVMGEKSTAFVASILNAAQKNPDLAKCEPQSILSSAMVAATLDLPIDSNLGFSAIVPYNVKRKDEKGRDYWVSVAQFQIMYKGFIQLALRSGQYKTINVSPIYEDEFDSYDIITGDIFIHPEAGGYREQENQEKIIGYVAFFRLLNGYERLEYWSVKKIEAHGQRYSKSYDNKNGLWKKDPHAMYAKTVLKNTLSKWGIMSVTMQSALAADQAVIKKFDKPIGDDNVDYIDAKGAEPPAVQTEGETGASMAEEETGAEPEAAAADRQAEQNADTGARAEEEETAAPSPKTPSARGKAEKNLFTDDEASALEEQYERQKAGVEPPDFGG
jgi:recombination protein RecT